MKWMLGLAILVACAFSLGGYVLAVEEPAFSRVLMDGPYEVRDYPAVVVAETLASGGQKEAASEGFRRLAGYIFGGNKSRRNIAMTAPVGQTLSADGWVVRFTMPSAYSMDTLPEPNDPKVHLRVLPPTRFAVLQFSGLARKDDVATKTAELEKLAGTHHLRANGPASLAQYDPPWTPWFMRRNEVMIPIAP